MQHMSIEARQEQVVARLRSVRGAHEKCLSDVGAEVGNRGSEWSIADLLRHANGEGYPNGLAGDEIPEVARICTVVDFFDALTMDRPYRKAVDNDEVVEMIRAENGTRFDPRIVKVFLEVRKDIEAIQAEYI